MRGVHISPSKELLDSVFDLEVNHPTSTEDIVFPGLCTGSRITIRDLTSDVVELHPSIRVPVPIQSESEGVPYTPKISSSV